MWQTIISPPPPQKISKYDFLLQYCISKGASDIEYCTKKPIWNIVFDMYISDM